MRAALGTAAVCAGVWLAGCEKDGGDSPDIGDNNPNVVTCIGDSMTDWGNPPWPSLVASRTGMTVINRGQGGAESDVGVAIVDGALAHDKPAYLTIQYGVNDVGDRHSRESIIRNLRTIVHAAQANRTVPVVCTLTPLYRSHAAFASTARLLNEQIREMVREENAELADLEKAFGTDDTLIGDDGLHPTAAGNEVIASVIARIMH